MVKKEEQNDKKEPEKSPTQFHFLTEYLIKVLLFVSVVAISKVAGACANEASLRERHRRVSTVVGQTVKFPLRNRGIPMTLTRNPSINGATNRLSWEKFQPLPPKDTLYWKASQSVGATNRIEWTGGWEGSQTYEPNPYHLNPFPLDRDVPLRRMPTIDRSPGHEKQWTGNLSWFNLQMQDKVSYDLKDEGMKLWYQVFYSAPTSYLLTWDTYNILTCRNLRNTIEADRRLLHLIDAGLAPRQPKVSRATIHWYRAWRACADIFSERVEEFGFLPQR